MSGKRRKVDPVLDEASVQPAHAESPAPVENADNYEFVVNEEDNSDYEGAITDLYGKVLFNGEKVGHLTAFLVQRLVSTQFYAWCDATDREVQECSVVFFDKKGGIQKKYAAKFPSLVNNDMAYLHITQVCIDEAHRGKDLGVGLLKALLDETAGRWAIAMMQPYPLDARGDGFRRAIQKLTRYFFRLGFKQCGTNPSSSDIKFSALCDVDYTGDILHKPAVTDLAVVLPLQDEVMTDVTKEIQQLVQEAEIPDLNTLALYAMRGMPSPAFNPAAFEAKVREIQARGGDINKSYALHFAVANKTRSALIAPLLTCGACVHSADKHGSTALHVAAACSNPNAVTILLMHGADKKARNAENKTALQLARATMKGLKTFAETFGWVGGGDPDAELCIQLLK